MVEIDSEKSMKLETSRNVTKSKRSLHWCRSISKKYLCTFYYSISQKVITLSGRRFITVSGGFITLSGSYYSIGRFYYIIGQLLQYRAFITLSVGTDAFTQHTRRINYQVAIWSHSHEARSLESRWQWVAAKEQQTRACHVRKRCGPERSSKPHTSLLHRRRLVVHKLEPVSA